MKSKVIQGAIMAEDPFDGVSMFSEGKEVFVHMYSDDYSDRNKVTEAVKAFITNHKLKLLYKFDSMKYRRTDGVISTIDSKRLVWVKTNIFGSVIATLKVVEGENVPAMYYRPKLSTTRKSIMDSWLEFMVPTLYQQIPPEPVAPDTRCRIGLLYIANGQIHIHWHMFEHRPIESFYYADGVLDNLERILDEDKSGLIFLPGVAGSGKTTLIRGLTSRLPEREFVFIPHGQLELMQNIGSVDQLIKVFRNKVLILEDAEGLFQQRDGKNTSGLSSMLLNLSDGLLGEIVQCKLVVTQNTFENIDPAFLRKGRLLYKHEFKALPEEQAKKVAAHLGKEVSEVKGEMVLTDIFAMPGGTPPQPADPIEQDEEEEGEDVEFDVIKGPEGEIIENNEILTIIVEEKFTK